MRSAGSLVLLIGTPTNFADCVIGSPTTWHRASQEDRFGLLQLSQPDLGAVLQLLLSTQLALQSLARRAGPPPPPQAWTAGFRSLLRHLGLSAAPPGAAPPAHWPKT